MILKHEPISMSVFFFRDHQFIMYIAKKATLNVGLDKAVKITAFS